MTGCGQGGTHTGQGAVKGLLARVAAHVGAQSVAAGMRDALASAVAPLAAVLLLAGADVVVVQVLDQVVHVLDVAGLAALPLAHRHLVLPKVVVLRHARVVVGRRGHAAVRVFAEVAQLLECRRGGMGSGRRRRRALVDAQPLAGPLVDVGRLHAAAAALDLVGEVVGPARGGSVQCSGGWARGVSTHSRRGQTQASPWRRVVAHSRVAGSGGGELLLLRRRHAPLQPLARPGAVHSSRRVAAPNFQLLFRLGSRLSPPQTPTQQVSHYNLPLPSQ